MNTKNLTNCYVEAMGHDAFECMPKTVLAAIAVSFATCGGDRLDEARNALLREWKILFHNGVVPQRPPQRLLRDVEVAE